MFSRADYKEDQSWSNISDPAASLKHDGANYFLVFNKEGSPSFFSRRPSVKGGFPDRTSQLPHLTSKPLPQFANQVLNVELVHTGHSSQGKEDHPRLSGILNSLPEKSIKSQEEHGPVRAIILDVIHPELPTYGEKLVHMKKVEEAFGRPELLKAINVKIGSKAVHDLIESTKNKGQEGVIITSLTTPESSNPRIKVKHVNTYNLKVKRVNQEYDILGNPKESAGSLTVVDANDREVADVGTGFSKEQRKDIWQNPHNWIGREIQVKGRTPSRNRIIAPVFNGDSDGSLEMIKSANTIEDQLLENLAQKYAEKGVNPQAILDNPLFQLMPLQKKIQFIEQTNSPIKETPSYRFGNLKTGLVGGGTGGIIAAIMAGAMHLPANKIYPAIGVGTAVGSSLGLIGGSIRSYLSKKRDEQTMRAAHSGGLDALAQRSLSKPVESSSLTGNKYLSMLEEQITPSGEKVVNLINSIY